MQKKEALSLLMHLLVALGKLKSKGLLHMKPSRNWMYFLQCKHTHYIEIYLIFFLNFTDLIKNVSNYNFGIHSQQTYKIEWFRQNWMVQHSVLEWIRNPNKKLPCFSSLGLGFYLTAVIFETGEMPTPTRLQNPTICGWGGPFHSNLTHS